MIEFFISAVVIVAFLLLYTLVINKIRHGEAIRCQLGLHDFDKQYSADYVINTCRICGKTKKEQI